MARYLLNSGVGLICSIGLLGQIRRTRTMSGHRRRRMEINGAERFILGSPVQYKVYSPTSVEHGFRLVRDDEQSLQSVVSSGLDQSCLYSLHHYYTYL
jgi:hypothetical protein